MNNSRATWVQAELTVSIYISSNVLSALNFTLLLRVARQAERK